MSCGYHDFFRQSEGCYFGLTPTNHTVMKKQGSSFTERGAFHFVKDMYNVIKTGMFWVGLKGGPDDLCRAQSNDS